MPVKVIFGLKQISRPPLGADLDRIGRSVTRVREHCSMDKVGNISCAQLFHRHSWEQSRWLLNVKKMANQLVSLFHYPQFANLGELELTILA